MLRDGMHQTADHAGVAPYKPNSLDGGCPFVAGAAMGGYIEVPRRVAEATKVRESPVSFADHLSQAQLFWVPLSPVEKDHTAQAFTFELGKCYEEVIKQRQLQVLANVDPDLCAAVAAGLGLAAPQTTETLADVTPSPALSQLGQSWPTTGRTIGIIADETSDLSAVTAIKAAITAGGMIPLIISGHGGTLGGSDTGLDVQRTFLTARSVECDAILVAGGPASAADAVASLDAKAANPTGGTRAIIDPRVTLMLAEAFRHGKPLGGWGQTDTAFAAAGVDPTVPGVVVGQDPTEVLEETVRLLAEHRIWHRFPAAAS